MATKTIEFELKKATTLVPLKGKTSVTVKTTGKVMVIDSEKSEDAYLPKYYTIVGNINSRLMLSRHGRFRKLEVRLPSEESSREAFIREVNNLFDQDIVDKV